MSASVLVLLYLAEVLNYGTGTLPQGEPCQIRNPNPYEWHAFTWDAEHRLTGVEWYTSDSLRARAVLRWSGTRLERIEVERSDPFERPDFIFTITWSGAYPAQMVRENAPDGQVTSGRKVWRWTWARDHRSARIASEGAGAREVRTAAFDASARLVAVTGEDPDDRFRLALDWSPDGRLLAQRTHYGEHRFTHDASGRIATRTILTGAERYLYECPAR